MVKKYEKPAIVALGTLAESTKAQKAQPPSDAIQLTQVGTFPGEDVPPDNGS